LSVDLCAAGIVGMSVQRQPDTRVWVWFEDGTAAVLTYEPDDEVICWNTISTQGSVKWVTVLPGEDDDEVYWSVERENSGNVIMTWEKMALHSECEGDTLSKNIDCHVVYEGADTTEITGLDHLNGLSVVAWGDGVPIPGPFIVSDGAVTLSTSVQDAVVGLAYDGKFKSTKLAQGAVAGTALSRQKRIDHVALIMNKVGWYGVSIGKDFDTMHRLPATLGNGRPLVATETVENWDFNGSPFNGGWGPDERVCFKISSPYPATFMGFVLSMTVNEPQVFGARVGAGASG
jgi:hypothetical protein